MVVRCSPIIPDLKQAYFKCAICSHALDVLIDRGRIDEPAVCPECKRVGSMEIIHNRYTTLLWLHCTTLHCFDYTVLTTHMNVFTYLNNIKWMRNNNFILSFLLTSIVGVCLWTSSWFACRKHPMKSRKERLHTQSLCLPSTIWWIQCGREIVLRLRGYLELFQDERILDYGLWGHCIGRILTRFTLGKNQQ